MEKKEGGVISKFEDPKLIQNLGDISIGDKKLKPLSRPSHYPPILPSTPKIRN